MRKTLIIAALCVIIQTKLFCQVSIININIQPYNVVPEALLNVGISNGGNEQQVQLLTQLYTSSGNVILSVKSQPFTLAKGMNAGFSGNRKTATVEYSANKQGNYLKTARNLPSGRYKVCSTLLLPSGSDKIDDFCDELEAEFNQHLYLVNPLNNDTIENKNPILSWTHGEPFTILNQGEFYRMVVTEMKKDQSAEEAITVNTPVMIKNYLKEHQVQYPYDAKELKAGTKYAWQVQKMSDGVMVNKTEAWIFNTQNTPENKSLKYVAMKNTLDGSFYTAYNGEVFFKFSEEYKSKGDLKFTLLDAKSNAVDIEITSDVPANTKGQGSAATKLKSAGDNRYDMNLDSGKLKSGFYTLIVKNEKNEPFYLKIFLP